MSNFTWDSIQRKKLRAQFYNWIFQGESKHLPLMDAEFQYYRQLLTPSVPSSSQRCDYIVPTAMYDNVATTKSYPPNDTSWGELNITRENIKDFLDKLLELTNKSNSLQIDDSEDTCNYYCDGFVKDLSQGYEKVHGYISLVVSGFVVGRYE